MRLLKILFSIFPVFIAAQGPVPIIRGIRGIDAKTDPMNLATAGGNLLVLDGANFGPSGARLSYSGPSPFTNGLNIGYRPVVLEQNDTAIIFQTSAGLGANLRFTVRTAGNVTQTSAPIGAYRIPVIQNITTLTGLTPFSIKPSGGDTIILSGTDFGPRTLPGIATIYTPTVRFGATAGTYGWMYGCTRSALTYATQMTCRVPVGGGTNHSVRIQVGVTGQWSVPNPNVSVSYITPTLVSTSPTLGFMNTAGLEQVVLRGVNMPYPSWVIAGLCPVSATFGPPEWPTKYRMRSCTGAFDTDGRTPTLSCQTPEGTGKGFIISATVGGQQTNTLYNRSIGYAAPNIYSFDGPWLESLTTGNETIFLNGANFGTNASLVDATYMLTLKDPIGSITNVTYKSPACNITRPHTQLGCLTAAGLGADLIWSVTVDGQRNVNPKTAYVTATIAEIRVLNSMSRVVKVAASTTGGDILQIKGNGFGPPGLNLVQSVELNGASGFYRRIYNVTHVDDTTIEFIGPPGGGQGIQVQLRIADQPSVPSTANFSYINPTVTGLAPPVGPTEGGTKIIVRATDLALQIPGLVTAAVWGNPLDGSQIQTYLPTTIVPRPDNDTTILTPFLPGMVSLTVPPGAGAKRLVCLVTYPIGTDAQAPLVQQDIGTCALFSYADPIIQAVVQTVPTTPEQIIAATSFFGPDAVAGGLVRVLTLYGNNLAAGLVSPYVTRSIQFFNNSVWSNTSGTFDFDLTTWFDQVATLYTVVPSATIRLVVTSMDPNGLLNDQLSNPVSYNNLSPIIQSNTTGPFPTVGGSRLTIQAQMLASATGLNITVGSALCPILDPATGLPLNPDQIYSRILTNPAVFSPAGPFTLGTTWTFDCSLPAGAGSAAPAILQRFPDGDTSPPIAISYIAPSITFVDGSPYDPFTRVQSPTVGRQILIQGANFGPCPIVTVATYSLEACSPDHTQIFIGLPAGEGDGVALLPPLGWTITVSAGDQVTPPILFRWAAPTLYAIAPQKNTSTFPTIGGEILVLKGTNFGQSVPGYPQSILPASLQIRADISMPGLNTTCGSPLRLDHETVTCILPEGAGTAQVGLSVGGATSTNIATFTYDAPSLFGDRLEEGPIVLPTNGSTTLWLNGANLGPSPAASCIFLSHYTALKQVPQCNNQEDYAGEGELPAANILFWNHTHIQFRAPPGTGAPLLKLYVRGQIAPTAPAIQYAAATISNVSRVSGPAIGGYPIQIIGTGFGGMPPAPNLSYPIPLPLPYPFYGPSQISMNGLCISASPSAGCQQLVLDIKDSAATFLVPEGIGTNYSFQFRVQDVGGWIQSAATIGLWSYDPPTPTNFNPNPVALGDTLNPSVLIQGQNLGTIRAFQNFPLADPSIEILLDGYQQFLPQRVLRNGADAGIEFQLDGAKLNAGPKTLKITVAQQSGVLLNSSLYALSVVCEKGYFAKTQEPCLKCPVGATCPGGLQYPVAAPGFFNLNSSYSAADACPSSNIIGTRDVCIVACSPAEACVGANGCAIGYRSTAPAYRCNTCEKGFYKQSNACVRCPDAPAAMIIGFLLIIAAAAAIGHFLNKKQVNLAFLSIAIDYFQVIAIFMNMRIMWPQQVKDIMYVFSAFNLNLDLLAPECLVAGVSYTQKFYAILLIPITLCIMLMTVNVAYIVYKAAYLGREKKDLWRHVGTLKAIGILLMYFFYLYVTRTIMDTFNCVPTMPPSYDADGRQIKYLIVEFEACGGGLQLRLMGPSIVGLILYTIGFPGGLAYILWRHREQIMFDQMLRAKGVGTDRFQNPYAYGVRKAYSRLYAQYKPDYFFWSIVVLLRKFLIAIAGVMFSTNPAFQMAACLLVLFLSYSLQTQCNPLMDPSEYGKVIESHIQSKDTSPIHARIHGMLVSVESRNTRRYHKNVLLKNGRIDGAAVIRAAWSWLFNYNTIETTLLFSGIMVCLLGIMLQSQYVIQTYDASGYNTITGVLMTILGTSVIYIITAFALEIIAAFTTNRKVMLRTKSAFRMETDAKTPGTVEMNPMMLRKAATDQLSIDSYEGLPPIEIWRLFKEQYRKQTKTIEDMNQSMAALKKGAQTAGEIEMIGPLRFTKREFKGVIGAVV